MKRLAVIVALLVPSASQAGPWTRALWRYYAKAGADYYTASGFVDPRTGERSGQGYFGQQYGLYGELGVSPGWPVQVSALVPVSIGTASFRDELHFGDREGSATTTRFGDARFGAQTSILREPFPLAVAAELKVPLYRNGTVGVEHEAYRQYFPLPGDGQVDVTGWVLAGTSIPDEPMWVEGGVGWRHRTEAFVGFDPGPGVTLVDGIAYRALVGVSLDRILLMAGGEGIQNVASSPYTRENLSVGPSALIGIWRGLALEARFAWEAWAKHQSRGIGFGVGVSMREPT